MENTYGYLAINRWTFNQDPRFPETISREFRNQVLSFLKINNWSLNFFGYLNAYRLFSGQIRMFIGACTLTGCALWTLSSLATSRSVNRFAVEGILTAISQMVRGYLESFASYGRMINACLDLVFTPLNFNHHAQPMITPRQGELHQW